MKTYNKIYKVNAWRENNKYFTVTQGEGGIKYPRLQVVDDNGAIDLAGSSITYTVTLPYGSEEIVDAIIVDATQGIVEFEVKSSMTSQAGLGFGELNISINNKVLKVGGINLNIAKATTGNAIEASDQFSALINALNKVLLVTPEGTATIPDGYVTNNMLADTIITLSKLSPEVWTIISNKADKGTMLEDYGITDAYTKSDTDKKLAQKLNLMPFDDEPKQNSPCYLTSGTVYNAIITKANKATTLKGYGIKDAYTIDEVDTALTAKADKGTMLEDYGITDAYTKSDTDKKLAQKLNLMPFDDAPMLDSPDYLTSGAVYNALVHKENVSNKIDSGSPVTDSSVNYPTIQYVYDLFLTQSEANTLLGTKYDSANIESGTATLTPHETQTDKSKSAVCTYKKIGDTVIVNTVVTMNAGSLGATTTMHFKNLPFANKTANSVLCVGISNKNGLFKGSVSASAWLQFVTQTGQTYTFVDGEQINFTCIYQIS